jgi:hypothetical protein
MDQQNVPWQVGVIIIGVVSVVSLYNCVYYCDTYIHTHNVPWHTHTHTELSHQRHAAGQSEGDSAVHGGAPGRPVGVIYNMYHNNRHI